VAGFEVPISAHKWLVFKRPMTFKQAAGRSSSLVDAAARCSRLWFLGKAAARTAFV